MTPHPAYVMHGTLRSFAPNALVKLLDAEYATLVEGAWPGLHAEFVADMWERGLREWLEGKGDCDDWAWLFRSWIIERNWRQGRSRRPIALFYLHYTQDGGPYHAINAAVVRRGELLTVLPIEPQPGGGPFELTEAERQSCTLIIG